MKRCTLLLALSALLACDSPTDSGPPPDVEAVSTDSSGPLFRYLEVSLADRAGVEVTYWTAGKPKLRLLTETRSREHHVFLPRLVAERTYSYEVRSVNRAGEKSEPLTGSLATGALPPELAALKFTAQGEPTMPLTMVELMITNTGFNGAFVADADGDIVWYWRTLGWINGVSRLENGNFVMLDADSGLVELSADAQVVSRLRNGSDKPYGLIHHDAIVTPQNTVYFFARDTKVIRDTSVVGEAIWEWRPESGQVVKKWSAFDHFDWALDRGGQSGAGNWMHANSIMIGARGNIIVSARNLEEVFSIAPNFGSIEWRLGGPHPTLQLSAEERFHSQHSAVETGPNRVLLFDNGLGRGVGEEWSRVSEFSIDSNTGRASLVWQFRPQPDIVATRVGSVVRLENGNSVAGFGWGQGYPIVVYEVNPAAQVVWSMVGDPSAFNRVYRMKPLSDVGGEVEVH